MSIASPPLRRVVRKSREATTPIVAEKPKGPATAPRKPLPPLVKVDNPRRLRIRSKDHRKLGGFVVCSPAWGSPFRTREIDGRWLVAWVGDEMRLEAYKPEAWEDIPCQDRQEASQLALEAFRDWITTPGTVRLAGSRQSDPERLQPGVFLPGWLPVSWRRFVDSGEPFEGLTMSTTPASFQTERSDQTATQCVQS